MSDQKIDFNPSVAIVVAGVIIAGAILYARYNPSAPAAGGQQAAANVRPPQEGDHFYGSRGAPVILIEYSDFECPYCAGAYPTLKRLVDESQGAVAWIYRHLPLDRIHPQARPSALASECVAEQLGDDGFWKFSERVFSDQSAMSEAQYRGFARELGADLAQYDSCMSSKKYEAKIDADVEEAYSNGASGTPFTVVYGYGVQTPVSGALPYEQFKAVINSLKARQ